MTALGHSFVLIQFSTVCRCRRWTRLQKYPSNSAIEETRDRDDPVGGWNIISNAVVAVCPLALMMAVHKTTQLFIEIYFLHFVTFVITSVRVGTNGFQLKAGLRNLAGLNEDLYIFQRELGRSEQKKRSFIKMLDLSFVSIMRSKRKKMRATLQRQFEL